MPITFPNKPGIIAYLTAGDPSLAATRDHSLASLMKLRCRLSSTAIDTHAACSYPQAMEVQLTPDLQAKLTRLAKQQGRDNAALITEAVERLVNYDARFSSKAEADPYWKQEEQLVASGAMKMPQEEMDWKRFFSHQQTATISTEAAVQAVIDSRGDR